MTDLRHKTLAPAFPWKTPTPTCSVDNLIRTPVRFPHDTHRSNNHAATSAINTGIRIKTGGRHASHQFLTILDPED